MVLFLSLCVFIQKVLWNYHHHHPYSSHQFWHFKQCLAQYVHFQTQERKKYNTIYLCYRVIVPLLHFLTFSTLKKGETVCSLGFCILLQPQILNLNKNLASFESRSTLFHSLSSSEFWVTVKIPWDPIRCAAAAAKSLQSCPTLCDPIDGSPRLPCPWDSPGKNTGVGCHFLLQCMKVKNQSEVTQSCPTLSDPTDCSLPGSSVHGIFLVSKIWDIFFATYYYSDYKFIPFVILHSFKWGLWQIFR